LTRLASVILSPDDPGPADAAGHAGLAFAMAGLLRAFPWHARRGQIYVPLPMLEHHGVTREDIVQGRSSSGLLTALAEMREIARAHLSRARAFDGAMPPASRPAYLPLALVPAFLNRMERRGYDPFTTVIDLPRWRKLWMIWRAAAARPQP
jgi:phytoene synthase